MKRKSFHEPNEMKRIASSQAMIRLTDAILGLDRDAFSAMVTAYLCFRADRMSNRELVRFLVTKEFGTSMEVGFKILVPVLVGILSDSEFRTLVFANLESTIRKSPT